MMKKSICVALIPLLIHRAGLRPIYITSACISFRVYRHRLLSLVVFETEICDETTLLS